MVPFVVYDDQPKETFQIVRALRDGSEDLHQNLRPWLLQHIAYVPHSVEDEHELVDYWRLFKMDDDMAHKLARRRVKFQDDQLQVSEDYKDEAGLFQFLIGVMLFAMRFKKFSTGRFLAVCDVMTAFLCAVSLGLVSLIRFTLHRIGEHNYYLRQAALINDHILMYACVAALGTRPCNDLLAALMGDDRLCLHAVAYEAKFKAMVDELWNIPLVTWSRLASVLGSDPPAPLELRKSVLSAAETAGAYIHRQFFMQVKQYPWCLAIGNIIDNVRHLWALVIPPEEPTANKIWKLGQRGVALFGLERAIKLLRQVRFSTMVVEQLHGLMSALHRFHPGYGEETLVMRALLAALKQLLADALHCDSREARKRAAKLLTLQRKHPDRVSGYGLFIGNWLRRYKAASPGRSLPKVERQEAMTEAAQQWALLPAEEQQDWMASADRHADEKKSVILRDIEAELLLDIAAFEKAKETDEQVRLNGVIVRFSTCAFSENDLFSLQAKIDEGAVAKHTQNRLERNIQPPALPCDEARALMIAEGFLGTDLPYILPDLQLWEREVAVYREHFENCVLVLPGEGGYRYFLFRYASQSPIFVALSVLQDAELSQFPCVQHIPNFHFDWVWRSEPAQYIYSYQLPSVHGGDVFIIPQCTLWYKHCVVSHANPMFLTDWVYNLRRAPPPPLAARKPPFDNEVEPSFYERFPWARRWESSAAASSTEPPAPSTHVADSGVTEDKVRAINEQLASMREEWRYEYAGSIGDHSDFVCDLTGGPWALLNLGRISDSVRAWTGGKDVEAFCRLYGLQITFGVKYSGERNWQRASILSLEWAHKMQFFYNLFLESGVRADFSDTSLASYTPRAEFTEALRTVPVSDKQWHTRARFLLDMRPK